ncbi:MAG: helix-turn-helix transcriptional regulator, partial [Candidatus Heimdallarchaeota archaeon]|nr:helix-turn-helix transcriptional regulator [Candidatus Heimdallarchaeota archaeon]
ILRDLTIGVSLFNGFIEANPDLTPKVLSQRLKELEADEIVNKIITSASPIKVEYLLTDRGRALNRILYEMALFSARQYPDQVFAHQPTDPEVLESFQAMFQINELETGISTGK